MSDHSADRRRGEIRAGILETLLESSNSPVFSVDAKYRYTSFNASHAAIMKALYNADIQFGRSILEYQTVDEDRRVTRVNLDRVLLGERVVEEAFSGEEALARHYFKVTHDPIRDNGEIIGALVQAVEITEQREAEESLRASEQRHRELVDHMTSGVVVFEPTGDAEDFLICEFNAAAQRIEQRGREETVGRLVTEAFAGIEEFGLLDVLRRVARTGEPEYYPTALYQVEGRPSWRENDVYRLPSGEVVTIYDDVTDRVRAEQTLVHAKNLLDLAEEIGHAGGWDYDVKNAHVTWTDEVYRVYGVESDYDPNDVSRDISFYAPESTPLVAEAFRRAVETGEPYDLEVELDRADGERIWVRTIGRPVVEGGAVVRVFGTIMDITERKRAEERLAAAAMQWRQTLDAMHDSVAVLDGDSRVVRCNAATTRLTGRSFKEIIGRPCYEVFHGTHHYHSACPQRRAFESRQVETSFMEQDGQWLRVTFAPKLDADGRVVGGVHVVTDVSDLKRSEQQLLESISRHQAVTDGVIAALARTVEARDPYTAGHERRVSELATAIAQQLGLDQQCLRAVHVAGELHDVGKITIPAEILSKPGRLSATEFELIQGHAEAGFEILKAIDFPWPVAEITLQHHERLDGSGYPGGRRGDEILPEARILAVADVVEAMISHRPYRPALPLDAAMAELEDGAGTRYDAAACEAAIRLFREHEFAFVE